MDQKEMEIADLKKRLEIAEADKDRCERKNRTLIEERNTETWRKDLAELNTKVGSLTAQLETAIKERDAQKGHAEKELDGKNVALAEVSRIGKALKKKEDEYDVVTNDLRGKTWGPWYAAGAMSAVVLVGLLLVFFSGRVLPKTGDTNQDALNAVNETNSMLYAERARQIELQKPDQTWNISRTKTADGKAILKIEVYPGPQFTERKAAADFVSTLICAAIRSKAVAQKRSNGDEWYISNSGNKLGTEIVWTDFFNEVLSKNLESLKEQLPEFNFNIQIEYLDANGQFRTRGAGGNFKDGSFQAFRNEKG